MGRDELRRGQQWTKTWPLYLRQLEEKIRCVYNGTYNWPDYVDRPRNWVAQTAADFSLLSVGAYQGYMTHMQGKRFVFKDFINF